MPYEAHKVSTPLQLTPEQIEALERHERDKIHYRGAVVFTSLDDKFTVYPEAGYSGTGTLQQQCGLDFHNDNLTDKERCKVFKLRYYRNGPTYDASVYCRIPNGVEHNVSNGLTRFLNWKMEGLTSGDRWRKYRRLVKRGRDIILPRLLYQFRDDEKQEWQYVFRTQHHGGIKYASDIVTGGSRRQRVASPHRPSAAAAAALQPPPPPPPKKPARTARPLPETPKATRTVSTPGGSKRPSSVPPSVTPSKMQRTSVLQRHPSQGVQPLLTPPRPEGPKRPVATPTPVKGTASKTVHKGQEESPQAAGKKDDNEQPPITKRPSVTITKIPLNPSKQATSIPPSAPSTSTAAPTRTMSTKRPATITPIPPPASSKSTVAATQEKATTEQATSEQSKKSVPSWIFEKQDQWSQDWMPSQKRPATVIHEDLESEVPDIPDDNDDHFVVDYGQDEEEPGSRVGRGSRVTFDSRAKKTSGGRKVQRPDVDYFDEINPADESSGDADKEGSNTVSGDYDPEVARIALEALDEFLPDTVSQVPNWKADGQKFDEFYRRLLVFEDAVQHALSGRRVKDVNPGKPLNKKQRSAQNMRIRALIKEKKERKKVANKRRREEERQTKIEANKKIKALEKAARERMSSSGKSTSDGSIYKPTTDETSEESATSVPSSAAIETATRTAARAKVSLPTIKELGEEDDIREILQVIADNQKTMQKSQNELVVKITNELENVTQGQTDLKEQLTGMEDMFTKLKMLVLHREVQLRTAETRAKNKLFRFLPLSEVGEDVETLFESPECQRAIQELILRKLMLKCIVAPDETELVKIAFDTCWSQKMQAHFHWREPTRDPENSEGWEKIRMSPAYIDFHNSCLLDMVQRPTGSPKKKVRDDSGGAKSAPAQKLYNAQTACFAYAGRKAKTRREWITARYEEKIKFFREHYNPEREGLEIQEPDLDFEIEMFYKYTRSQSIRDIDEPLPQATRAQVTFDLDVGKPLDKHALKDAIDELRALGYDKPFSIDRDEWHRLFDWGDIREMLKQQMDHLVEEQATKETKEKEPNQAEDDAEEASDEDPRLAESQTIVMKGGKITEVINRDIRNKVTRQLFIDEDKDGNESEDSKSGEKEPRETKENDKDSLATMSDFDE